MSALTFREVLEATTTFGTAARIDVQRCLMALFAHHEDLAAQLPHLAQAHRRCGSSQGAIIIEVLALPDRPHISPDLYADCYLALADWVTRWNRLQMRQVDGDSEEPCVQSKG